MPGGNKKKEVLGFLNKVSKRFIKLFISLQPLMQKGRMETQKRERSSPIPATPQINDSFVIGARAVFRVCL